MMDKYTKARPQKNDEDSLQKSITDTATHNLYPLQDRRETRHTQRAHIHIDWYYSRITGQNWVEHPHTSTQSRPLRCYPTPGRHE